MCSIQWAMCVNVLLSFWEARAMREKRPIRVGSLSEPDSLIGVEEPLPDLAVVALAVRLLSDLGLANSSRAASTALLLGPALTVLLVSVSVLHFVCFSD